MSILETPLAQARRATALLNAVLYRAVILPYRHLQCLLPFRLDKNRRLERSIHLFREEYKVPVLPSSSCAFGGPQWSWACPAWCWWACSPRLSLLRLLGIVSVIQLFVEPIGWPDHIQWLAFMVLILWRGPGVISLDHLLRRRVFGQTRWS